MKIIYLIGPDFTVFSLAYPHLKYLIDQKNQVLLLSEKFNKNLDLDINHISIPFSRQKLSYKDFFAIKKINNCIKSTGFEILKHKEKKEGFLENVYSEKTNKKIDFFHLGSKNNWKEIVPKELHEKINNIFEEDLKNLKY